MVLVTALVGCGSRNAILLAVAPSTPGLQYLGVPSRLLGMIYYTIPILADCNFASSAYYFLNGYLEGFIRGYDLYFTGLFSVLTDCSFYSSPSEPAVSSPGHIRYPPIHTGSKIPTPPSIKPQISCWLNPSSAAWCQQPSAMPHEAGCGGSGDGVFMEKRARRGGAG